MKRCSLIERLINRLVNSCLVQSDEQPLDVVQLLSKPGGTCWGKHRNLAHSTGIRLSLASKSSS